jgi:hypothetical protein
MKQLFSFLLTAITVNAFATVRTVSNNPATIAQFNTIQSAVNASSSGDTIYVHGSPTNYDIVTITDKSLVLIGPGFGPDKNIPLTVSIPGFTINGSAGSSDFCELQGLIVFNFVANQGVNNLRLIRNQFQGNFNFQHTTAASDFLIEGNYFQSQIRTNGSATLTNFLFQNNMFYGVPCCTSGNISGFTNSVNVLFNHNIFIGPPGTFQIFSSNCRFLILTNNIFVNRNPAINLSVSTFSNNITFNCGPVGDTAWIRNNNVDGGGNIASQNPQMFDQASVDAGSGNPLMNLAIAAGPANNAGTDGKDIGLLFDATGSLNWANSRNSRLPRINIMNVVNPTVAAGGTITVTVEAKTSN